MGVHIMYKRLILSIFMAIFLVACGSGDNLESSEDSTTNSIDMEQKETDIETPKEEEASENENKE